MPRCIVVDASIFMVDEPGKEGVCDEHDVTAWMALLHEVHSRPGILIVRYPNRVPRR